MHFCVRLALLLSLQVLPSMTLALPRPVAFAYRPDRDVKVVALAGSFNGWAANAVLMKRAGVGGPFEATVELKEGRHFYKFVVDGAFIADPRAAERVPDGFGGYNSVVSVGAVDARPAKVGDGVISEAFLRHRVDRDAGRVGAGKVSLRLLVRASDVEQVAVVLPEGAVAAQRVASDGDEELWEAVLAAAPGKYLFRVSDAGRVVNVGPKGVGTRASGVGSFEGAGIKGHGAPEWLADAVFYQIFPDRFKNGDRGNDPVGTRAWGSKPTNTSWSGGDLEGVRQELDYVVKLGANGLYLNPIFESESNHGYNTADYEAVARRFGGNPAFDRLLAELRRRGMRVLLDGVFNHTGTAFFAFQDLVKRGAQSAYASWYTVKSWPVNATGKPSYECWWGFGSLPRLRVDANPVVRDYLLGVVKRWTLAGIDGWRLDVPNEVDHPFWRAFRKVVRAANPEGYIVGEIWEDGSDWLKGDEFDGVMNYRFRRAMLEFVAKGTIDATAAARQLDRVRMDYAPGVTSALYNLLGSHDTERFRTLAGGDAWRLNAATTALMTAAGIPSVYYGDEVGLAGEKDPDNRRDFPWGEASDTNPVLIHHRRVIALRRSERLGHFGEASHFAAGPDVLGFSRTGPGGAVLLVLVNRGAESVVPADHMDPSLEWRVVEGTSGRLAARFTTVLLGRKKN